MKTREHWIDAVRSLACLCVLTTHAPIPGNASGEGFISVINYYAMAGASVLFFMISGSLVFDRPKEMRPFLRTRLLRIFLPMCVWSVIFLSIDAITGERSPYETARCMLMIPFVPQVGVYWFIYVIFGIYIFTPPISTWLNNCKRTDCETILVVWVLTLLLPYARYISDDFATTVTPLNGMFYYFYGYIGFAVLGFYLRRYVRFGEIGFRHVAAAAAVAISPWVLYATTDIDHSDIQNRLSINVAALAAVYFLAIKHIRFPDRIGRMATDFANHSFGIYLVHFPIMRGLVWPMVEPYHIHYALQIPIIVITTAALSYGLVHLISYLPKAKYVVGLQQSKNQ